ncbi:TPA: restriction endonuclease subunit S [Escherichia coli]|uniref:restriction endonuclease subunit S n=4 Tax=Escherichia coli TaxID=562 RepID=UPI000774FFDB|nr:restriction endonuclease subunit S [Escherichia coli]KXQ90389.1 restriction endonuclease [Escherichia coli]SQK33378.1 putative type I restriction modification system protein [Escherichia coli]SQT09219.1 putative type I restriction modification system protein [Escherichia coli]SRZ45576.1 putative type I restriction modification system protein [Escherichia coli]
MSWPMVKLGDVCTINPRLPKNANPEQEVTFLAMAAVSEKGEISSQETRILHETKKGFTYFERGDVLLAKITPCFENGKATLTNNLNTQIGFGSTEFHVLRAFPDLILPEFIFYLVWNERFRIAAAKEMTGSAGQKRVSTDYLKEYKFYLPSIFEQEKIVAALNKGYSIHRKRQQAIKLADDFLRAKFLEMFGTPANNIHRFPTGKIRDLVDSVNYGTSAKASIDSGEYPILRMGNITYQGGWDFTDLKYLDLSVKEKDKFLVKEGDLLFNRTNSKELVGKTAVYEENRPMAFAGYLIRVRPNPIGNNYYISGYLNSIHGKITLMNMCKSIVGMANINAQELQNIEILIPPKHLQDEYEIIYKKIKRGLSIYDKSAMQLQLLASNLSNKYFM